MGIINKFIWKDSSAPASYLHGLPDACEPHSVATDQRVCNPTSYICRDCCRSEGYNAEQGRILQAFTVYLTIVAGLPEKADVVPHTCACRHHQQYNLAEHCQVQGAQCLYLLAPMKYFSSVSQLACGCLNNNNGPQWQATGKSCPWNGSLILVLQDFIYTVTWLLGHQQGPYKCPPHAHKTIYCEHRRPVVLLDNHGSSCICRNRPQRGT